MLADTTKGVFGAGTATQVANSRFYVAALCYLFGFVCLRSRPAMLRSSLLRAVTWPAQQQGIVVASTAT